MGFEPTIWAGERPQTYALDRAATETGLWMLILVIILFYCTKYICWWRFWLWCSWFGSMQSCTLLDINVRLGTIPSTLKMGGGICLRNVLSTYTTTRCQDPDHNLNNLFLRNQQIAIRPIWFFPFCENQYLKALAVCFALFPFVNDIIRVEDENEAERKMI